MNETLSIVCPKCGEAMDLYMAQLDDPITCAACTAQFIPAAVLPKPEPKRTVAQQMADSARHSAEERQREEALRERAWGEKVARVDGHWSSGRTAPGLFYGGGAAVVFALFFLIGLIVAGFSGSVAGAGVGIGLVMFGCTIWIAETVRSLEHTVKHWRVDGRTPGCAAPSAS